VDLGHSDRLLSTTVKQNPVSDAGNPVGWSHRVFLVAVRFNYRVGQESQEKRFCDEHKKISFQCQTYFY
jgi:hypothetical protein